MIKPRSGVTKDVANLLQTMGKEQKVKEELHRDPENIMPDFKAIALSPMPPFVGDGDDLLILHNSKDV